MTETLEIAGTIGASALAASALLLAGRRARLFALGAAMTIAVALVLGQAWDGPLAGVRESAGRVAVLLAVALAIIGVLAACFLRWPAAMPLAAFAALPFRIPVDAGGESSNLLVPLYAVIVAGLVAAFVRIAAPGRGAPASDAVGATTLSVPRPLALTLAAAVAFYGLQAAYSSDVAFAARNVGFFLVPFAALFVLLVEVEWSPRLLGAALAVIAASALLFAGIGIGQHIAGRIFWNDALESSNDFHFYFRVNSLFWDPNIYGRYLVLALLLLSACLLWTRESRRALAVAGGIAVIWLGLLFGFSQTSFIALLAGIAVLGALRWSWKGAAIVAPLCALAIAGAIVAFAAGSDTSAREISQGRSTLVKGGLELFADRPLQGYGSASFSDAFGEAEGIPEGKTTISHNEPVTVAAEQGVLGIAAYLALIAASLWTLLSGMRSIAPGLGAPPAAVGDPWRGGDAAGRLARIALLAAFCALFVHTIGYAGYLTDPLTWALLAVGAALAAGTSAGPSRSAAGGPSG